MECWRKIAVSVKFGDGTRRIVCRRLDVVKWQSQTGVHEPCDSLVDAGVVVDFLAAFGADLMYWACHIL